MKRKWLQAINIGKMGATLVTGDSMVSGLMEKKISRNREVKIRFFPGSK